MDRTIKYVVILATAKDKKEAEKIARGLVIKKLAACVNIVPQVRSIYRWQGKIETSGESLLVIKSTKALINRVIKETRKLHSYTVPEIIALPILSGNPDYLKWIKDSVVLR